MFILFKDIKELTEHIKRWNFKIYKLLEINKKDSLLLKNRQDLNRHFTKKKKEKKHKWPINTSKSVQYSCK